MDNEQNGSASFWSRNQKMMIRLAVVLVIIIGAVIYANTQPSTPTEDDTKQEEGLPIENDASMEEGSAAGVSVTDGKDAEKPKITVAEEIPGETIRSTSESITVIIQRGDSYTKAARRALAEYLGEDSQNLKSEQKIYVEDFLQKRVTEKQRLFSGSEVSFTIDDIQSAIDSAESLTDGQIQNLSKYVPLVPQLL